LLAINVAAVINACKQQCSLRGPNNFFQNNFLFPNHIRKKYFISWRKKDTAEDISLLIKTKPNRSTIRKPPNSNCLYQDD